MYTDEKINTQWNWQNIIKILLVIIVSLYIVRTIYSVYSAHSVMSMTSDIISLKKKQFNKLNNESNDQISKVQNGISDGIKSIEQNAKHVEDKMTDFSKNFNESLEKELTKMRERHRREYIENFLNDHFYYYDVALYESDRKKAIESTHYTLPDYAQYDALRNKALQCHIERHNHQEEVNYKNAIAELKFEHNEKHISKIPKPDYWKWPLTKGQHSTISLHPIPVFGVMTLEGRCIGA